MESDPVPLFYQSGLLSIKGYEREFQIYHWGFPNKEVEEEFSRFVQSGSSSL